MGEEINSKHIIEIIQEQGESREEKLEKLLKNEEDNYKKQEKIAANKIVAIFKENQFSFVQIEWILRYVYNQLRNNPLNFE